MHRTRGQLPWFALACLLTQPAALLAQQAASDDLGISPTRPTVANSGNIQNKGVLQVETGYDAYPQGVPGNQQTVDMSFFYVPLDRLRLDFTWSAYTHQQ